MTLFLSDPRSDLVAGDVVPPEAGLPAPRGPASAMLLGLLVQPPHAIAAGVLPAPSAVQAVTDEDLQLALYLCYELHYTGFVGVDPDWEWEPSLLAWRAELEAATVTGLHDLIGPLDQYGGLDVPDALAALIAADDGPSLAKFLAGRADIDQFREFVVHRSIYHLKEADPHTWGIPRLQGPVKAALVEIQADEYGGGQFTDMHAELFRTTMRELGLRTTYRAYVNDVPAVTLAANNAVSLFGLHRRWLPALLGHLAALEMTSSLPNRRYGNGLRRLGVSPTTTQFYDEHIQADAVHEQIAAHDLCGRYVKEHPDHAADILFGAACALATDRLVSEHMLQRWREGRSSLRHGPTQDSP